MYQTHLITELYIVDIYVEVRFFPNINKSVRNTPLHHSLGKLGFLILAKII